MRAARWTSSPTRPSGWSAADPVWSPIRARTVEPAGHASTASACWTATAAATACVASAKTQNIPSPGRLSTVPSWPLTAPATMAW
jgi:hypothetical protein